MRKQIARGAGHVAAAPLTLAQGVCLGVGYAGTGVRKVGAVIETAGFVSAAKMAEYRDVVGNNVEDLILGSAAPESTDLPQEA